MRRSSSSILLWSFWINFLMNIYDDVTHTSVSDLPKKLWQKFCSFLWNTSGIRFTSVFYFYCFCCKLQGFVTSLIFLLYCEHLCVFVARKISAKAVEITNGKRLLRMLERRTLWYTFTNGRLGDCGMNKTWLDLQTILVVQNIALATFYYKRTSHCKLKGKSFWTRPTKQPWT